MVYICTLQVGNFTTAQKIKFSIEDFFNKCDRIRRKLRIWSHLLKKFLMENLGAMLIWPTKDQIRLSMPDSFKNTSPNTRCTLDCTELFCQSSSSFKVQSSLYSFYKHHVTYKGLVGISPSGAIIFINQLYEGSISDKKVVSRSGILDLQFWEGVLWMADRGLLQMILKL